MWLALDFYSWPCDENNQLEFRSFNSWPQYYKRLPEIFSFYDQTSHSLQFEFVCKLQYNLIIAKPKTMTGIFNCGLNIQLTTKINGLYLDCLFLQ